MDKSALIASLFLAAGLCAAQTPVRGAPDSPSPVRIEIVQPADGATVHDNRGDVAVKLSAEPPPNGAVELMLDGQPAPVVRSNDDVFFLAGVNRGEHRLQARVTGVDGETLGESMPVTFYLWKASALFPHARQGGSANRNGKP